MLTDSMVSQNSTQDTSTACKYDSHQRQMTVRFSNGYQYVVHGISADSYQQFLAAPSHGEHYHKFIKDSYPIERVR